MRSKDELIDELLGIIAHIDGILHLYEDDERDRLILKISEYRYRTDELSECPRREELRSRLDDLFLKLTGPLS